LSAFLRGNSERPLRVTLHSSSFSSASDEDSEAINALHDLSRFSEIQAVDTEAGKLPHLQIGTFKAESQEIPFIVTNRGQETELKITQAQYWAELAAQLAGQTDPQYHDSKVVFLDLVVARAHNHLGHDLLVTLSRPLLDNRTQSNMSTINIRTPIEAAKIVGLFARSRETYTCRGRVSLGRGLFYWVLARHRLPSMWRYFSGCIEADAIRKDGTLYLGQSILVRAVRALEARDGIGMQFYLAQGNNTRDAIMYHFDYLTLLLVGVFDAEARIAHRVYGVTQPQERNASFRRKDYWEALGHNGATNLYNTISGQRFQDLLTLLHELRNTIHGATLPTTGYRGFARQEESYVTVLPDYRQALWQVATRYSSLDHWGLVEQRNELWFEPYSYAVTLVDDCFKAADTIAATTEIDKLFPSGHSIPPLADQPPEDEIFGKRTRHRLAILG